jgi:sarcosine oxidase subunit gamma
MTQKEHVNMLNKAHLTVADDERTRARIYPAPVQLDSRQQSSLVGLADAMAAHARRYSDAFRFRELPFREIAMLRADPGNPSLEQALEQLTGCSLPLTANTVAENEAYSVWWLGPDEWLIHSKQVQTPTIEHGFHPLAASRFVVSVDVSSGYTTFEIGGQHARDVLQKGCPLDLHPRVMQIGQCAQSHYFKAGVMLRPVSAKCYELVVRRSFADYFYRIMLTAADEFLI